MAAAHPAVARLAPAMRFSGPRRAIRSRAAQPRRGGAESVALVARSTEQLAETADAVRAAGAQAHVFTADLSDLDAIGALVDGIRSALGRVDVLIDNAATVDPLSPTERLDPHAIVTTLTVNVAAPIALTGRLLPEPIARGTGETVNVSSGAAAHPETMTGGGSYAASKATLEAHTVNLAAELEGTGVTANVYRPGVVDTAMQETLRTRDVAEVGERLHAQFTGCYEDGKLITAESSAAQLIEHLGSGETGQVWRFWRARM